MKIGFSGTHKGMTTMQRDRVKALVRILSQAKGLIAHHGDCVGADAQFHAICQYYNIPIVLHPAKNVGQKRAFCYGAQLTFKAKNPLDRNIDIVMASELMIIAPYQDEEIQRSGTWATWRYAHKHKRTIHLILPNGAIRDDVI